MIIGGFCTFPALAWGLGTWTLAFTLHTSAPCTKHLPNPIHVFFKLRYNLHLELKCCDCNFDKCTYLYILHSCQSRGHFHHPTTFLCQLFLNHCEAWGNNCTDSCHHSLVFPCLSEWNPVVCSCICISHCVCLEIHPHGVYIPHFLGCLGQELPVLLSHWMTIPLW